MSILHRLVRLLVLVVVLFAAMAMCVTGWRPEQWGGVIQLLAEVQPHAGYAGAALFFLGLLFILTGLRRRSRDRFLSFDTDGGTVSISTAAIAEYISKLAGEFPSIIRMKPRVVPGRNNVDIVVDVRVKSGPQIHELCEALQQRVRETMTTGLGVSQVRRVEISVSEINCEHRTS